jgi:hypothetical protein
VVSVKFRKNCLEFLDSNLHPTSWVVISDDPHTEVLIAREKELFRLKQDEHHTGTMVKTSVPT